MLPFVNFIHSLGSFPTRSPFVNFIHSLGNLSR